MKKGNSKTNAAPLRPSPKKYYNYSIAKCAVCQPLSKKTRGICEKTRDFFHFTAFVRRFKPLPLDKARQICYDTHGALASLRVIYINGRRLGRFP